MLDKADRGLVMKVSACDIYTKIHFRRHSGGVRRLNDEGARFEPRTGAILPHRGSGGWVPMRRNLALSWIRGGRFCHMDRRSCHCGDAEIDWFGYPGLDIWGEGGGRWGANGFLRNVLISPAAPK